MDYELAKELKEAGFPQENSDYSYRDSTKFGRGVEIQQEDSATGEFLCSIPDLSELIEACNNMTALTKTAPERGLMRARWIAEAWPYLMDVQTEQVQSIGKTPEEAVAKLWLALNKK